MGVSPFKLLEARHPPGVEAIDFPVAIPSDLCGNVSPRILRSRLLAELSFIKETVDSRSTAAPMRYKHNFNELLRRIPASKSNESESVYRLTLALKTNSNNADELTYDKFLLRANGQFQIFRCQQHTLFMDMNSVPNIILIDCATHAASNNTVSSVGKDQNSIKGENAIVGTDDQAFQSEDAKSL